VLWGKERGPGVKCQFCSNLATVHLTDIVKNQKKVIHLCQACADAQNLLHQQQLNLPAIVQNLISQHLSPQTDELARLVCPACGIRYMEFRAQGRLGCPHDYTVFRAGLMTLLRRIHRHERHIGKRPRRLEKSPGRRAELLNLRRQLQCAVASEAYEEAARLRDLLRQKEATDESG
jgi:protein arginine kinase activator